MSENITVEEKTINLAEENECNPHSQIKLSRSETLYWEELLQSYTDIFSDEKPGRTQEFQHEIWVTKDLPFKMKQYFIPFSRMEKVEQILLQMEEWGVISRCATPYVNPLVTTVKKMGMFGSATA